MSVHLINWSNIHKHGDTWMQHHALRHKVFRGRCAWNIAEHDGLEYDEFDTPLARYLVSVGEDGRVHGAIRLIPTTHPFMSQTHWPEMFAGPPPSGPEIWEATRFCSDHTLPIEQRRACVLDLLEASMSFGLENGITRYVAVMSTLMFPIGLRRNGCSYRRLGPAVSIDGVPTGAAEVPINENVLHDIRIKRLLSSPSLAPQAATEDCLTS